MSLLQLLLIACGLMAMMVLGWSALSGPNPVKEGNRRLQAVRYRHSDSATDRVEAQMRKAVAARKPQMHKIAGSGSRIEALMLRLHRTGKNWTLQNYLYTSLGVALAVTVIVYIKSHAAMLSLGAGILLGAGLPHFAVGFMINRRLNAFISKFPDGIELIVRGLRSGLPVTETLAIISSEIPGPVGEEFKLITERIKIGKTMEDALQETADRLGIPEFQFFCITLAIQRETGGNLAETLSNLADVLRKRAQMKLKIRAMSSESKASAYIVGSLPFVVFTLLWWVNPDYIGKFFSDDRLIVAGLGGLVWMGIGVGIMAKMVSFEI
ncbi:type II secretion system F family protein [Novosphingobium sp. MW5]|nr:type II secretion system F family protein [Novosphingobium sp. MW5]